MITKTVIRYFACHPDHIIDKFHFELWPDSDLLPLDIMENSIQIYPRKEFGQIDPDLCIVSCLISPKVEKEIEYQVGIINPIMKLNSPDTMTVLDISEKTFVSLDDIKEKHPQTSGSFTIISKDEHGNDIETIHDKMIEANWVL